MGAHGPRPTLPPRPDRERGTKQRPTRPRGDRVGDGDQSPRRQVPQAEPLLAQHDDLTSKLDAQSLDISAADAIRAGGLDCDHADPIDRMLAAQSLLRRVALVSKDAAFGQLRGFSIIW